MRQSPHYGAHRHRLCASGHSFLGNDWGDIAQHDSRMHVLGVISPIAGYVQQWLLGGNLFQQLRQYCSVSGVVGGHADGPYLQRLCVNTDVQFAPLAAALGSMLFALPLAFAKELDARGIDQQVQPAELGWYANCTSRLRWRRYSVLKSGTGHGSPDSASSDWTKPVVWRKASSKRFLIVRQNLMAAFENCGLRPRSSLAAATKPFFYPTRWSMSNAP